MDCRGLWSRLTGLRLLAIGLAGSMFLAPLFYAGVLYICVRSRNVWIGIARNDRGYDSHPVNRDAELLRVVRMNDPA